MDQQAASRATLVAVAVLVHVEAAIIVEEVARPLGDPRVAAAVAR